MMKEESEENENRNMMSSSEEAMFTHLDEVRNLISNLVQESSAEETSFAARCKTLSRLRMIFDQYLEYSTLLDPHLELLLVSSALMDRIRKIVQSQFLCAQCAPGDNNTEDGTEQQQLAFLLSTIYSLSKVCGHKKIQRFLPHDAADVEPVLNILRSYESRDDPKTIVEHAEEGAPQQWETIYVLLLWMGMLSYVPFDLTTIDSFITSDSPSNGEQQACSMLLVDSILRTAQHHLLDSGPTREAASSCLAQFLIRRDLSAGPLTWFVTSWSRKYMMHIVRPSASEGPLESDPYLSATNSTFLIMGILQTLSTIFKLAPARSDLLVCIDTLWEPLILLSEMNSSNSMLRKLLVKLFARVGCAYLPPKVAPWRYQRGKRHLLENLSTTQINDVQETVHENITESFASSKAATEFDNETDLALIDIPDQLEDVVDQLLQGLRDKATIVRWSAAKGIGRVTERLPMICADDVVEAVFALCNNREHDNAWHGACLALAELARRGLLLPHRLQDVVPIVTRAIQYDVRRGQHSVGSHVRDAACYVCWAFARAYAPSVLKPYMSTLSQSMVIACLFDREVNCRRAASAAFQECVGRQGGQNVKHGIDILTAADYFSLGNRSDAYKTVACSVAKFDEYRIPIIDHVSSVKLFHWDPQIRVLSSKVLHDLVTIDEKQNFLQTVVLQKMIPQCTSDDLYVRHGAVLGVAEIILGLGESKSIVWQANEIKAEISGLVQAIEKARLYRGRGGEMMRGGVCRLIECISLASIPLTVKEQVRLLDSVDSNLKHPNEDIQQAAVSALHALTRTYFPVGENGPSLRLQSRVVDYFIDRILNDDNAAATRGYSLALGSLPAKLLAPNDAVLSKVIACLCAVSRPNRKVGGECDAETRRNALRSLSKVCRTVGFSGSECDARNLAGYPLVGLSTSHAQMVFSSFLESMGDYGTDRRGDVGSWSRIESMLGMEELLYLAVNASPGIPHTGAENLLGNSNNGGHDPVYIPDIFVRLKYFEENSTIRVRESLIGKRSFRSTHSDSDHVYVDEILCARIVGAMLKQLSEKLDLVRSVAGGCLERVLLSTLPIVPFIPQKKVLIEAMNLSTRYKVTKEAVENNYGAPSITFPMVVKAMIIDSFFEDIVSGIIISVGGITESVVKYASSSLLDWMKAMKQRKATGALARLGNVLIKLFHQHQREERVTLPLLKTLDKLFSSGCFDKLLESEVSTFPVELLSRLREEALGCSSVPRLLAIVNVSLAILSPKRGKEAQEDVLPFIMQLLGHGYPRVRRYTAEQLYVKLLEDDCLAFISDCENHEKIMHLLLEVAWDDDLEPPGCVRMSRNRVAELMNVHLSDSNNDQRKQSKSNIQKIDEFESYKSLIEDVGR